jgi:dTDP-4-dehydrorhamnose reductase
VVYGADPQRKNFVCRLVDTLRSFKPLHVPDDQVGSPTYASNLAQAVVYLEQHGACGTYNVSGPVRVSRYEFAQEVARVFGLDGDFVRPTTTAAVGQVAPRPLNAGLVSKKAQALLPFALLDYRAGLRRFYEETAATDDL